MMEQRAPHVTSCEGSREGAPVGLLRPPRRGYARLLDGPLPGAPDVPPLPHRLPFRLPMSLRLAPARRAAHATLGALVVCFATTVAGPLPHASAAPQAPAATEVTSTLDGARRTPPAVTYPVTRVVDGDTLWIERGGRTDKLRLLCVDTEERLELGGSLSATKPGTPFGSACEEWAKDYFARLGRDGQPARIGLAFPGDVEQRDVYGRLLCHVILEDGTDFNVLLVREGKSPYFDKYGYSALAHGAFVAAEAEARAARRGIWHPETNAGAEKRPYERLLPWWEARAQAVEGFVARHAKAPTAVVSAEVPEELEAALAAEHPRIEVFGSIFQFFDEDDGSLTVLFRGGDKQRSLRVRIPAEERASYADLDLPGTTAEFVQNYLYVAGRLTRGPRGFELVGVRPRDWRRGGPDPVYPEPGPEQGPRESTKEPKPAAAGGDGAPAAR